MKLAHCFMPAWQNFNLIHLCTEGNESFVTEGSVCVCVCRAMFGEAALAFEG